MEPESTNDSDARIPCVQGLGDPDPVFVCWREDVDSVDVIALHGQTISDGQMRWQGIGRPRKDDKSTRLFFPREAFSGKNGQKPACRFPAARSIICCQWYPVKKNPDGPGSCPSLEMDDESGDHCFGLDSRTGIFFVRSSGVARDCKLSCQCQKKSQRKTGKWLDNTSVKSLPAPGLSRMHGDHCSLEELSPTCGGLGLTIPFFFCPEQSAKWPVLLKGAGHSSRKEASSRTSGECPRLIRYSCVLFSILLPGDEYPVKRW
jgi:hypothetical protein